MKEEIIIRILYVRMVLVLKATVLMLSSIIWSYYQRSFDLRYAKYISDDIDNFQAQQYIFDILDSSDEPQTNKIT